MHRFVVLAVLLVAPALADTNAVTLGLVPRFTVRDARRFNLDVDPSVPLPGPSAPAPGTLPAPPSPPAALPALVAGADRSADETPIGQAAFLTSQFDAETSIGLAIPPRAAAFDAHLAAVYSVTDPALLDAIWLWFQEEPTTLTIEDGASNAVVRYALATREAVSGAQFTINTWATQGTVLSSNGVSVRSAPWGPKIGAIAGGTSLALDAPADGVWYKVSGGGWICGLWVQGN